MSLEWLLAHPELDTSNDIEEALAARNYNSKVCACLLALRDSCVCVCGRGGGSFERGGGGGA